MFGKLQGALQTLAGAKPGPGRHRAAGAGLPDPVRRQGEPAGRRSAWRVLVVTALALVLTIDRTLNSIWRVQAPRPLAQRVLIYWAVDDARARCCWAPQPEHHAPTRSRLRAGWSAAMPGALQLLLDVIEFVLLAAGLAALYRYVPNTPVRRGHAWAGGLFAAIGIEVAQAAAGAATSARCRPIRWSTAPSRRCRSCWCGSTSPGSSCCWAR